MDFSFNYYHFHELNEMEKAKFIICILNKCKYELDIYELQIDDFFKEDFKQDVKLNIIQLIKKQEFSYLFYDSYLEYQKNVLSDNIIHTKFFNDYFKKRYGLSFSDEQKNEIILSIEFFKQFKSDYFQYKFIAYIKKMIQNEYLIYVKKITRMKKQIMRLKYYKSLSLVNDDSHLEFIARMAYLNINEKRLLKLYVSKTQTELAQDYHMTQQSISYKLKKIKEKL